jgi:hypothetical protein
MNILGLSIVVNYNLGSVVSNRFLETKFLDVIGCRDESVEIPLIIIKKVYKQFMNFIQNLQVYMFLICVATYLGLIY